jgi:hypothetical protein
VPGDVPRRVGRSPFAGTSVPRLQQILVITISCDWNLEAEQTIRT